VKALLRVRLRLDEDAAAAAEAALEPFAVALSRYKVQDGRRWEVEALVQGASDRAAIRAALGHIGDPRFLPLPKRDWIRQSRKALPPIVAGRFYLRGSHVRGRTPRGKLALQIDAGAAFGTGRHETTRGCLLAMDRLARRRSSFHRVLDMGCGSGILALAAARLWPARVLCADNDADAVRVARENALINGLEERVTVVRSRGYGAAAIREAGPFDLILANILARPLQGMAPSLARHLVPGGRAILSGLLVAQEPQVLEAHLRRGLVLDFRLRLSAWSILVLRQPGAGRTTLVPKARRRPGAPLRQPKCGRACLQAALGALELKFAGLRRARSASSSATQSRSPRTRPMSLSIWLSN
jgi:ribosomal protein L11 methyltransferase